MKIDAAYYTGNGSFELRQVEDVPPGPGEVQVETAYCGICGTDLHVYLGHMEARIGDNRVIGHEMSGRVSAIGEGVEGFAVGEPVVVRPLAHCGACPACKAGHIHVCHNLKFLGLDTDGAFQNRWTVPAHVLHKLPAGMALDHAALVEPLAVAVHDVRRARVAVGEDVLVIGGGPIGMLVALVARHAGARVTVSEVNENRLKLAEDMGFATANPKREDVAARVMAETGNKGADVVFEVSGTQPGVDLMTAVTATRGRICMVAIHAQKPQIDMFRFFWREIELIGARTYEITDFDAAIAMLSDGIGVETLITEIRPLAELPQAFKALTENPNSMKTLIRVSEEAA
ncbi:zinc-dependent alcohol dehydrogenase [Paracoccus seriniphilus]|uniref:2-desacetyl-2-hydroxyethyl bacteriochlorophyllide A dehydrogenase n=1 Tax=Paracoccus seriniphilus TaxID=184748 RepID=A0A239Q286_9RHOB|nr:alcohol dehydrogenase catalytic domain-containing protein [Paracoccus seriniphilus]WCR15889.1 alcohol dehydrogenase catalytic domain-containing protein [Paracoccus seriniphilus]SNT76312.1 2-desacetyl-2-hydroxyethyl bacteriochlorophyllide A dehydrogenase [Paracoccus seriniphilus]